ncbi:serine hydrolase domain-containing protein [Calycomorphotria hydatis]|nr:serine hydrolase domain-containing protein [Calycomorphotria hydatis]
MESDNLGDLNIDPDRWQRVIQLAEELCDSDQVPALGITVGNDSRFLTPIFRGRQQLEESHPVHDDPIFLTASITKPIVAMGVMLLVERGAITLADRVSDLLPEFRGDGRRNVRVRHLLTHTSGVPDMPTDNAEFRKQGAPLSTFLEKACGEPLLFQPGTSFCYSSMGYLLLGEIIARQSGQPAPQFLDDEFFAPLGMTSTALGAPDDWFIGESPTASRLAEIRFPEQLDYGPSGDWNSQYWRQLGAPWGGLLSTPTDLAKFATMVLNGGRLGDRQFLSPATLSCSTINQLTHLPDLPEVDRRCKPWGYGWRKQWPGHGAFFGDLVSPQAYGHWGATGALLWIDPVFSRFCVILTTEPPDGRGRILSRLSNAIAASFGI